MTDQPVTPPSDRDEAIARVLRSDLPDEQKRRIVQLLIAERGGFEGGLTAVADRMITEAEDFLRQH
jgi:hypothetical protein